MKFSKKTKFIVTSIAVCSTGFIFANNIDPAKQRAMSKKSTALDHEPYLNRNLNGGTRPVPDIVDPADPGKLTENETHIESLDGNTSITISRKGMTKNTNDDGSKTYTLLGDVDFNGSKSSYKREITVTQTSDNSFEVSGTIKESAVSTIPSGTTYTQTVSIVDEKIKITGSTSDGKTYSAEIKPIGVNEYQITATVTDPSGAQSDAKVYTFYSETIVGSAEEFDPTML